MALVETAGVRTRYAFEPDGNPGTFDWYRDIDNWDFEDRTMRPGLAHTSPSLSRTASTEDIDTTSATFAITKELWVLLNVLETDASIPTSTRPSTSERKSAARSCRRLPLVVHEIKLLEGLVSDFARGGPSQHDVRRPRIVTRYKSVILDLEDNYSSNTEAVVADLFERMSLLLLQYRDAVDPFYSCIICSEVVRSSQFPARVTSSCQHLVSTCFDCLKNWVAASLSERGFTALKCMECSATLNGDDIRAVATQETFQRYNDLSARTVLHSMPDFHFCLNPKCNSGQIHYGGPKLECHVCRNQICAKHGVAWHEGETCGQYDARRTDAQEEYEASEGLKVKVARACPTCDAPIEKNGGCSHMNCWKCDSHFNWEEAPSYFAKAFEWERDRSKLSEVSQDTRKRMLLWRLLAKMVPNRGRTTAAATPTTDGSDTTEDYC